MRQQVGANSSKKNQGRVNLTMKEGKVISKSPFLHRGTGNWVDSLSLLCNSQGKDHWGLQFGGKLFVLCFLQQSSSDFAKHELW